MWSVPPEQWMTVQTYVDQPLLLDGFKFDFRVYVLLDSIQPLRFHVYREGISRFCTRPYVPPDPSNLDDVFSHLTNYSLQIKSEDFQQNNGKSEEKEEVSSKRSISMVLRQLQAQGVPVDVDRFWSDIEDICAKTFLALLPTFRARFKAVFPRWTSDKASPCFQTFGFDLMLDCDLKLWLLEINARPSLEYNSLFDLALKQNMLEKALKQLGLILPAHTTFASRRRVILHPTASKHEADLQARDAKQASGDSLGADPVHLKTHEEAISRYVGEFSTVVPSESGKYAPIMCFEDPRLDMLFDTYTSGDVCSPTCRLMTLHSFKAMVTNNYFLPTLPVRQSLATLQVLYTSLLRSTERGMSFDRYCEFLLHLALERSPYQGQPGRSLTALLDTGGINAASIQAQSSHADGLGGLQRPVGNLDRGDGKAKGDSGQSGDYLCVDMTSCTGATSTKAMICAVLARFPDRFVEKQRRGRQKEAADKPRRAQSEATLASYRYGDIIILDPESARLSQSYTIMRPGSCINFFPGSLQLATIDKVQSLGSVFPEQYDFTLPSWRLPAQMPDFQASFVDGNNYALDCADSRQMVSSWKDVKRVTKEKRNVPINAYETVRSPLLLFGKPFSVTLFILLEEINPLRLHLYQEGIVSRGFGPSEQQDGATKVTKSSLSILFSQLVQEQSKARKLTPRVFWREAEEVIRKTFLGVWSCMYARFQTVFPTWNSDSGDRSPCFQLFSVELQFDQQCKCWLLDLDPSPSLEHHSLFELALQQSLLENILWTLRFLVPSRHSPSNIPMLLRPTNGEVREEVTASEYHRLFQSAFERHASCFRSLSINVQKSDAYKEIWEYQTGCGLAPLFQDYTQSNIHVKNCQQISATKFAAFCLDYGLLPNKDLQIAFLSALQTGERAMDFHRFLLFMRQHAEETHPTETKVKAFRLLAESIKRKRATLMGNKKVKGMRTNLIVAPRVDFASISVDSWASTPPSPQQSSASDPSSCPPAASVPTVGPPSEPHPQHRKYNGGQIVPSPTNFVTNVPDSPFTLPRTRPGGPLLPADKSDNPSGVNVASVVMPPIRISGDSTRRVATGDSVTFPPPGTLAFQKGETTVSRSPTPPDIPRTKLRKSPVPRTLVNSSRQPGG